MNKQNQRKHRVMAASVDGLSVRGQRSASSSDDGAATPKKAAAHRGANNSAGSSARKIAVEKTQTRRSIEDEIARLEELERRNAEISSDIEDDELDELDQAFSEDASGEDVDDEALAETTQSDEEEAMETDEAAPKKANPKANKKQHKFKKPVWRLLGAALLAFELFAGLRLALTLKNFSMLAGRYLTVIFVLMALFALLSGFKLLRVKTSAPSRVLFGILTLGLSCGYLYGGSLLGSVDDALRGMMATMEHEKQSYKVLVLRSSSYQAIGDLHAKKVGFQENDPNLDAAIKRLGEDVDAKPIKYEDPVSMQLGLTEKKLAAIVLPDSMYRILSENEAQREFYDSVRVLHEFEVKIAKKVEVAEKKDITEKPFAIYISGSDSRHGIDEVARSDVNIVAVVNPSKNKILLVSTPRDYYVQLHGTTGTKDKLTHAGIYGVDMSRQTLEDLLGIKIDYAAKVGFETVVRVVDSLGGITINSDQYFTGSDGCVFQQGEQRLNGRCALAFARERYAYASGDRHRGQNQQQVIGAIIREGTKVENLNRFPELFRSMNGLFWSSLQYDDVAKFVRKQQTDMKPWAIENYNLDGTGAMLPTYSMGSQPLYVMIPDQATVDGAKAKIAEYMAE